MKPKVAVIGAGIIGLLQAKLLAQQGYTVTIFSDQLPLNTTTLASGAIWMPYKVWPEEAVLRWAECSLDYYKKLSVIEPSGVVLRTHHAFYGEATKRPLWMALLAEGDRPNCKIPDRVVECHSTQLPVMNPCQLIQYLLMQLVSLKVSIKQQKITDFNQVLDYRFIVNASGMGAINLAADDSLYPIKGQTFTLTQPNHTIDQSLFYEYNGLTTLIVPHRQHVTIGVTVLEKDTSLDYDHNAEKQLRESAEFFYPQLAQSIVIDRRVGHRPTRAAGIRLEAEYLEPNDQWLFHSYGHAGGGLTLAPGCAHDVLCRIEVLANA